VSYTTVKRLDESRQPAINPTVKVDPVILKAAKQIYRLYVESYSAQLPRPLGVVINRSNMSGKLIYNHLILLPRESFVPIEVIELGEYH
jgi:hypothetical protein